MRRLLKFKADKERCEILVRYDIEVKGGGKDIVTLESNEKPSTALIVQLGVMATHLISIAELPESWLKDLTIISVTRTFSEDSIGLVITGLRALAHQDVPLVLNSPYTTSFDVQCQLDLTELERLVLRYVDGEERAQKTLAFGAAPAAHAVN